MDESGFIMRIAERLYLAADVLSRRAERKMGKMEPMVWIDGGVV